MSVRQARVAIPELSTPLTVRAPTPRELQGSGEDISTADAMLAILNRIVRASVIEPKLSEAQVAALSFESKNLICETSLRLNPQTAALLRRARKAGR